MTPTFSVIVPTAGRATLTQTLASIAPQLGLGDELLVRRADCEWCNESRDLLCAKATGTHLLFMDDDDVYADGAFTLIRAVVAAHPARTHIFKMRHGNTEY